VNLSIMFRSELLVNLSVMFRSEPLVNLSVMFRSECKLFYISNYNVCILCLSCNIKRSKTTAKVYENS
jgi:hypothetical protein